MAIATLPTRRLGVTDMHVTPVGFGAWAIRGGDGFFGWGPQDDADSVATWRRSPPRSPAPARARARSCPPPTADG